MTALLGQLGIRAWYDGRERRERVLILVGGAVLLAYLLLAGVYRPLAAMRAEALSDIATLEALTARASAVAEAPARATPVSPVPNAAAITDSAVAVGLVIRRLEPEGARTSIEFEEADFAVLVEWLALLESRHALKVATIELDRRPSPGVVSARITVEN